LLIAKTIAEEKNATPAQIALAWLPDDPRAARAHPGAGGEHANDMHDLLVSLEGRPMLEE
jgi:aryl-alcohol dehydrogenase-like predicted oxidoreductase